VSYELDVDPDARSQIMALPTHALTSVADAMAMLELTPWNGARFTRTTQAEPCGHSRLVVPA